MIQKLTGAIKRAKGSALALSLIFTFVGILITVSYLEYIQIASRMAYTTSTQDYAKIIARAGLARHLFRLQINFFKYEQSVLEGEIMGGKYEVISRSFYDVGMRNIEILAIGTHGKNKAAITKQLMANTPTDYVRFFDGNYLNHFGQDYSNQFRLGHQCLFWLGPVHSNGSIGLGGWDHDYGAWLAGGNPKDTDTTYRVGNPNETLLNLVMNWPYAVLHHPDYKKRPARWGNLFFIVKDRSIPGPVISTAGYFFIPRAFPKNSKNHPHVAGDTGFKDTYLNTGRGDFANPIFVGEDEDPEIIIDINDGTYPIEWDNYVEDDRVGRFGLFSKLKSFEYYNLVTCKKTGSLAHGDSATVLRMANEGGVGLDFYPFLKCNASSLAGVDKTTQAWGNAYDHPDKLGDIRGIIEAVFPNGSLRYPLDKFRDDMPRVRLETKDTPDGLLRMANSGAALIKIPTIRKLVGGVDYANQPFKGLMEWRNQLRRVYRSFIDPRFDYQNATGRLMVVVNHASREKMECKGDYVPPLLREVPGVKLNRAKQWRCHPSNGSSHPFSVADDTYLHPKSPITRFDVTNDRLTDVYGVGDNPMMLRAVTRVATTDGAAALWSNDYVIAFLHVTQETTPNCGYWYKNEDGMAYGSLPTVEPLGKLDTNCEYYGPSQCAHNLKIRRYDGEKIELKKGMDRTPHLQFNNPDKLTAGTWVYLEMNSRFVNDGAGLNTHLYTSANNDPVSDPASYDKSTQYLLNTSGVPLTPNAYAIMGTQNIPPAGSYVPHTNAGIFLGAQTAKDIGRYFSAGKITEIYNHFKTNSAGIWDGQCGFQVPIDIFATAFFHNPSESAPTNKWPDVYAPYLFRRIFYNVQNPSTLATAETGYAPTWPGGAGGPTTNSMIASEVIDACGPPGGAKMADVLFVKGGPNQQMIVSSAVTDLYVNPWFKLHFVPGTKDVGTSAWNYSTQEMDSYSAYSEAGNRGFDDYPGGSMRSGPFNFLYRVTSAGQIVPTWKGNLWLDYENKVPAYNWFAPLTEKVRVLDLGTISSANFPRMALDRSEPGVIYSKVPLFVFGNPTVPVTVVSEKNIYLKSINGYFPSTAAGEPVKKMGTPDRPSVGIVSAEGVYVVPKDEVSKGYSFPGGPGRILLNNVAIWTTKGFFSLMSYRPKMVLCGSVITMDSSFGKKYHESYINYGESLLGHGGTRTPISGLGATDASYRHNLAEGTMTFQRESFVYTKTFRGDDRKTDERVEGPPPHFPIYYQNVYEKSTSLDYALAYYRALRPYVDGNKEIPEGLVQRIREEIGKTQ